MSQLPEKEQYLVHLGEKLRQAGNAATADTIDNVLHELQQSHWYEMSLGLLSAITDPMVQDVAYELHDSVIGAVRADISPVSYVKLVYYVVFSPNSDPERVMALVESAFAMLVSQGCAQCKYAMQCIRALLLLEHTSEKYSAQVTTPGTVPHTVRRILVDVDAYVKSLPMHEVEPLLIMLQAKARGRDEELRKQYTDYYKNAFDIVNFMGKAEMPLVASDVAVLAYKAAIAGLLSEKVYNFGKFINFPPFVNPLAQSAEHSWLLELIHHCNEGNVEAFEQLYQRHGEVLTQTTGLPETEAELSRKVRLMALLHLVFYTPFNKRVFDLQTIAQRCQVGVEETEPLLLAALAQGIIKGWIDGMAREVHITWVEPRVLSLPEVKALAEHVSAWRKQAENVYTNFHSMTEVM